MEEIGLEKENYLAEQILKTIEPYKKHGTIEELELEVGRDLALNIGFLTKIFKKSGIDVKIEETKGSLVKIKSLVVDEDGV